MRGTFFDRKMPIQSLDYWYRTSGKCHVVSNGVVVQEYLENEKPLAATRGISVTSTH